MRLPNHGKTPHRTLRFGAVFALVLLGAESVWAYEPGSRAFSRAPFTLFILAIAYLLVEMIWTALATRRAKRVAEPADGAAKPGTVAFRGLARAVFVVLALFFLALTTSKPLTIPGHVIALAWALVVVVLTVVAGRISAKPMAVFPALVVADLALILVMNEAARRFGLQPNPLPLAVLALVLHVGVIARREAAAILGSKVTLAAVIVAAALFPGGTLTPAINSRLDQLHRPGVAQLIPGTEQPIQTVFADPLTGYIFYVTREEPSKIRGISPDWSDRIFFQDRRERFVRLAAGTMPGRMVALSEATDGRSAFVMALPDMNVRANFAYELMPMGNRMGPPAFFAQMDSRRYVATVMREDGPSLMSCTFHSEDEEPTSDLGVGCAVTPLDVSSPGPVVQDSPLGYAYVLDPGTWTHWTSRLFMIAADRAKIVLNHDFPYAVGDLEISRTGLMLYVAETWRRSILYLTARDLTPQLTAAIHIFPTRLLLDPDGTILYAGSYIDGQVQLVNARNGQVARPISVAPGLRDLSLDSQRQYLYAATDAGVVRVDLSLAVKPIAGVKMPSASPSATTVKEN